MDIDEYTNENFFEVIDVELWERLGREYDDSTFSTINRPMPLKVIQSKGVEVELNHDIKITDLNDGYKNFKSNDDDTITFKIEVIIGKYDMWGWGDETGYTDKGYVKNWIKHWYKKLRPLYVVTNAFEIPNGVYLLTDIGSIKQDYTRYVTMTLEFTTFKELKLWRYQNDNTVVQAAIDALTPKPAATTATAASTSSKTLANCKPYTEIKYSSTKLVTECNKLLQEKLYKLGYLSKDNIDGWYGPVTMEAVKKFQRAWNSKGGNLAVDGDCGPVTLSKIVTW